MPDGQKALEFFRQLGIFSERYINQNVKKAVPLSPWGLDKMGPIKGAVVHYTADENLDSVIRWFNDPALNAKASSHVVIADRKLGSQTMLTSDLPLVEALPATVVQCRPPSMVAWHGTWTNDTHYGVECVNAGELRTADGKTFHTWKPKAQGAPEWTAEWKSVYKTPLQAWGRWWDPFTADQVAAVVAVLRYVRDLPGSELRRPLVIGHEHVQAVNTKRANGKPMATDKRDPGPTCPLHGIRAAVFDEWRPMEQATWWNLMRQDPVTVFTERTHMVQRVVAAVSNMAEMPPAELAWERFRSAVHTLPVKDDSFGPWGKLALWLLGYYIPSVEGEGNMAERLAGHLDTDEVQSVSLFQRMAGIGIDGRPGVETRWALLERLKDRGIL